MAAPRFRSRKQTIWRNTNIQFDHLLKKMLATWIRHGLKFFILQSFAQRTGKERIRTKQTI